MIHGCLCEVRIHRLRSAIYGFTNCAQQIHLYSKQPIFGLTQEWLMREVWSSRQGICLFTPCVGSFTSPGIDTRSKGPTAFILFRKTQIQTISNVEGQVFTPNNETCLVRESNPRPAACQADGLTTTLPRLSVLILFIRLIPS